MGARSHPLIDYYAASVRAAIVEIGGERGDGSTSHFLRFAADHRLPFWSIDIAQRPSEHPSVITGTSGEDWLTHTLPTLRTQVAFAYLDNFDWPYASLGHKRWLQDQVAEYAARGVSLTRENSMQAHLNQTLLLEPHLAPDAAILFDDTWPRPSTAPGPRFDGKGATALAHLLARGWRVLDASDPAIERYDGFVLVARGRWEKRLPPPRADGWTWNARDDARDWGRAAAAAARLVPPGHTLVLAGLGKNAKRLWRYLRSTGVRAAFLDDLVERWPDLARLSDAELTASHHVLITPDSADDLHQRLRSTAAAAVFTVPEALEHDRSLARQLAAA